MNLNKIGLWVMGIIMSAVAIGQLGPLQHWIWKAQAKLIYESRTSAWGSPRFFPKSSKNFSKEKSKTQIH